MEWLNCISSIKCALKRDDLLCQNIGFSKEIENTDKQTNKQLIRCFIFPVHDVTVYLSLPHWNLSSDLSNHFQLIIITIAISTWQLPLSKVLHVDSMLSTFSFIFDKCLSIFFSLCVFSFISSAYCLRKKNSLKKHQIKQIKKSKEEEEEEVNREWKQLV